MAVYVVSDIHGELELFLAGLDLIRFSDRDELYVIGDAIDRGDSGIEVLQYIMEHENMDLLIGNHEFLMLNSVNLQGLWSCNGPDALLWRYGNGGDATWKKYTMLNDEERSKLLTWLKKRFVIKVIPVKGTDYCLTHSHYKKSCENKRYHQLTYGEVFSITWTSMYRKDTETHNPFNVYESYDYTYSTDDVSEYDLLYMIKRINGMGKSEMWEDDSPLWARPQRGAMELFPSGYMQVVGHTPVRRPLEEECLLTLDTFSTYPNGNPFGNEKFVLIDTSDPSWHELT